VKAILHPFRKGFFEIGKIETFVYEKKVWVRKRRKYERKEVLVQFQLLK